MRTRPPASTAPERPWTDAARRALGELARLTHAMWHWVVRTSPDETEVRDRLDRSERAVQVDPFFGDAPTEAGEAPGSVPVVFDRHGDVEMLDAEMPGPVVAPRAAPSEAVAAPMAAVREGVLDMVGRASEKLRDASDLVRMRTVGLAATVPVVAAAVRSKYEEYRQRREEAAEDRRWERARKAEELRIMDEQVSRLWKDVDDATRDAKRPIALKKLQAGLQAIWDALPEKDEVIEWLLDAPPFPGEDVGDVVAALEGIEPADRGPSGLRNIGAPLAAAGGSIGRVAERAMSLGIERGRKALSVLRRPPAADAGPPLPPPLPRPHPQEALLLSRLRSAHPAGGPVREAVRVPAAEAEAAGPVPEIDPWLRQIREGAELRVLEAWRRRDRESEERERERMERLRADGEAAAAADAARKAERARTLRAEREAYESRVREGWRESARGMEGRRAGRRAEESERREMHARIGRLAAEDLERRGASEAWTPFVDDFWNGLAAVARERQEHREAEMRFAAAERDLLTRQEGRTGLGIRKRRFDDGPDEPTGPSTPAHRERRPRGRQARKSKRKAARRTARRGRQRARRAPRKARR